MKNLNISLKKFLACFLSFSLSALFVSADTLPEDMEKNSQGQMTMEENVPTFMVTAMPKILSLSKMFKARPLLQIEAPNDWIWFQKDFDQVRIQIQFPTTPIGVDYGNSHVYCSTEGHTVYSFCFEELDREVNINDYVEATISELVELLGAHVLSAEAFVQENGNGFWDIFVVVPALEMPGNQSLMSFFKTRILKEDNCVFAIQTIAFDINDLEHHESFVNSFSLEKKEGDFHILPYPENSYDDLFLEMNR